MVNVLIKEGKYKGKYVALKDFNDLKVVGFGETAKDAYELAGTKGCHNPVIVFAPLKDITQIY